MKLIMAPGKEEDWVVLRYGKSLWRGAMSVNGHNVEVRWSFLSPMVSKKLPCTLCASRRTH